MNLRFSLCSEFPMNSSCYCYIPNNSVQADLYHNANNFINSQSVGSCQINFQCDITVMLNSLHQLSLLTKIFPAFSQLLLFFSFLFLFTSEDVNVTLALTLATLNETLKETLYLLIPVAIEKPTRHLQPGSTSSPGPPPVRSPFQSFTTLEFFADHTGLDHSCTGYRLSIVLSTVILSPISRMKMKNLLNVSCTVIKII